MIQIISEIISVFIVTGLMETFWTLYIHNVRDEKMHKAGLYSLLIFVSSAFATKLYVENGWMIVPAALGAYAGTYVSKYLYKKPNN